MILASIRLYINFVYLFRLSSTVTVNLQIGVYSATPDTRLRSNAKIVKASYLSQLLALALSLRPTSLEFPLISQTCVHSVGLNDQ